MQRRRNQIVLGIAEVGPGGANHRVGSSSTRGAFGIVGGGEVGPIGAMLLFRQGMRVRVVDDV